MTSLPMFPLGSVLFPHMPLPLRVFEPRYRAMLQQVLADDVPEFGVVLIERGQEVGGGDVRLGTGTLARVVHVDTDDEGDALVIVVVGGERIVVDEWLGEDPFPMARVSRLPDLELRAEDAPLRLRVEAEVRRVLRDSADRGEAEWAPDVRLADDPAAALWQLAAIAPLGPLDRHRLLRATSAEDLLVTLLDAVQGIDETHRFL